jgi:hypothetical protein
MSTQQRTLSTEKKRPATIKKETIIFHAWEHNPKDVTINFSKSCKIIKKSMDSLRKNGKPQLIVIVGLSGTGKTALAKVLEYSGTKTTYINSREIKDEFSHEKEKMIASNIITDPLTTYILDEPEHFKQDDLSSSIKAHTGKGGKAVVLIQDVRDITISSHYRLHKIDHRRGVYGYWRMKMLSLYKKTTTAL